uniref:Uncharacterized protein n=1 Tax=Arundo donax TaxID=35708 RepID=A0A0A9H3Q1_ARUDO
MHALFTCGVLANEKQIMQGTHFLCSPAKGFGGWWLMFVCCGFGVLAFMHFPLCHFRLWAMVYSGKFQI